MRQCCNFLQRKPVRSRSPEWEREIRDRSHADGEDDGFVLRLEEPNNYSVYSQISGHMPPASPPSNQAIASQILEASLYFSPWAEKASRSPPTIPSAETYWRQCYRWNIGWCKHWTTEIWHWFFDYFNKTVCIFIWRRHMPSADLSLFQKS